MKRLISLLAAAAFVASLSSVAFAADTMKSGAMSGGAMSGSSMKKCPKGTTPVSAYTKKDGTKVAATCRKSKSSTMTKK